MRLGKTPARPGAVKLALRGYVNLSVLPTPPDIFGHGRMVRTAWNMLGNDAYGDCVWAGAAHETLLWNYEAGRQVPFTEACVVQDYSAATGFDPNDPSTDQGTDMQAAASYRRKTGIRDANGQRHKVGAYLALRPGDWEEHMLAAYIFGAVGLGIEFPGSAMAQFNERRPWDPVSGSRIEGGHYIPLIGWDDAWMTIVTWGTEHPMTKDFFRRYNDESIVYLSQDFLRGGISLDGFDLAHLQADLAALSHS